MFLPMRILVAGTHRSGSTWVANVLRDSQRLRAVYEPDYPEVDIMGTLSGDRLGRYPALRADDEDARYATVWNFAFKGGWPWHPSPVLQRLGRVARAAPSPLRAAALITAARAIPLLRRQPEHVVIQSTNCAFSLEWIEARYAPKVIALWRNPLSVTASWMVLNIRDDLSIAQLPRVRERWIEPLGIPVPRPSASRLVRVTWTVGMLMVALKHTAVQHPDWIVLSYDRVARDPEPGFAALCKSLDLSWTEAGSAYIDAADRPGFVDRGRNPLAAPDTAHAAPRSRRADQQDRYRQRLTPAQIAEARAVFADLPLGDWAPPPEAALG